MGSGESKPRTAEEVFFHTFMELYPNDDFDKTFRTQHFLSIPQEHNHKIAAQQRLEQQRQTLEEVNYHFIIYFYN